ncbi:MAG: putative porin [bacterium]
MKQALLLFAFIACLTTEASAAWTDNLTLSGDFRYRHEFIEQQGQETASRNRIRARVALKTEVTPGIDIVLQLATGDDNPVSVNQTLTDAASSKPVRWDLAYCRIERDWLPGLTVDAGKVVNPWFRPGEWEMVWSNNLHPEGVSGRYARSFAGIDAKLIGGWFWVEERSKALDSYMGGYQGVFAYDLSEARLSRVTIGAAYYSYVNVRGWPTFYLEDNSFGNSVDTLGQYLTDFELVELSAQAEFVVHEIPIKPVFDYIFNTTADSLETGWLFGCEIGRADSVGTIAARWSYREVEADAVLGAFTDGILGGGGSNVRGHDISFDLMLAYHTMLRISYFDCKRNLQQPHDYRRVIVDLRLQF